VPVPAELRNETVVHVFYLHGFGSSPESGKAAFLREHLSPFAMALHAPDFNQPDYTTLTATRMLAELGAAIDALPAGPVALIGSSLGGFIAIHAAARQAVTPMHPITRLVLLAPAVDFASGRDGWLTDAELDDWRRTDRRDVFHYAYERTLPLRYALYDDAHRYDAFVARFQMPALVFQGSRDTVVNPDRVKAWAAPRKNVTLRMVDDTHQLQESLPAIWQEIAPFLGLGKASR
jgi:pimeloyl-ACP methyl ester carboxylesterase